MRAFITGITGFCGAHLAAHLAAAGAEVSGMVRRAMPAGDKSQGRTRFLQGDLLNPPEIHRALRMVEPDIIFHMGGRIFPMDDLPMLMQVNAVGTDYLLRAVLTLGRNVPVVIASSASVYGAPGERELPLREDAPIRPLTAYGISKMAQEAVALQYRRVWGLQIVIARTFNISGPGENPQFVCAALARQIAEIAAGLREAVVRVGAVETWRAFTDVRDVVEAYNLLAKQERAHAIYNVCSRTVRSVRWVLETLLGLSGHPIRVEDHLPRPAAIEVPRLEGDPAKIEAETGWRPAIPLEQTLRDLLDHWRGRVTAETQRDHTPGPSTATRSGW